VAYTTIVGKLNTREIASKMLELLAQEPEGIRYTDLVDRIAEFSPETPRANIIMELAAFPGRQKRLVTVPSPGLYVLTAAAKELQTGTEAPHPIGSMQSGAKAPLWKVGTQNGFEAPQSKRADITDLLGHYFKNAALPYHYNSAWDHCFGFFQKHREAMRSDEELADKGALHIAAYLGSSGMIFSSRRVFRASYKAYIPVVKLLVNGRYDSFVGFDPTRKPISSLIEALFNSDGLVAQTKRAIAALDDRLDLPDLMVSKILLGTLCCSIGYDLDVVRGLRQCGVSSKSTPHSIADAAAFFAAHEEVLRNFSDVNPGILYPPFRLLDAYFFELGGRYANAEGIPSEEGWSVL